MRRAGHWDSLGSYRETIWLTRQNGVAAAAAAAAVAVAVAVAVAATAVEAAAAAAPGAGLPVVLRVQRLVVSGWTRDTAGI